jgi:hypothetical protein
MTEMTCSGQAGRRFCSQAVTLAIFGGAIGSILEGCSSPTSPSNAPPPPTVNGTPVSGGITLAIDSSSPLSTVGSAAQVQVSVGDFLVGHTL